MKIVFWIDHISTINPSTDTSYALMLGAQKRGHSVFIVYEQEISLQKRKVYLDCQQIQIDPQKESPIQCIKHTTLQEKDVDCFFIRKNPPFDQNYLETTWLLDNMSQKTLFVNSPSGIRNVNEKIWISHIDEFIPDTLITSNQKKFLAFLKNYSTVILKPTDGFAGKSVFLISQNDTNANVTFETLSNNGTKYVIVQEYIPASKQGDKRIIILNGTILGQFNRVHSLLDHRNNVSAGGKFVSCKLTETDTKIVEKLIPYLKQYGLYFVGLDIIGKYIIEVNVTSPMGLQQINSLDNASIQDTVIESIEKTLA